MRAAGQKPYATGLPILIVALILVLGGVLYWFVWNDAPFVSDDSGEYLSIAADIVDGGLDNLYDRSFGYPILLTLVNVEERPNRLLYFVQLSMHLVAVFTLGYLLIRLGLSRKLIGLFLVLALLPPSVAISAFVLTEGLAEFLVVVGTVLLLLSLGDGGKRFKAVQLALSGLAFGSAAVVRPSFQLLFVLLAVIGFITLRSGRADIRSRVLLAICMIVLPAAVIGGAYAYSYARVGFAGLDPSFGIHFSTKTAGVVERLPDEYAEIRDILISNRDTILVEPFSQHTGENYIWRAVPELHEVTGLDKPGLSRFLVGMNLVLIRKAPLHYLQEVLDAAVLYWFPTTTRLSNFDSRSTQLLWTVVHFTVILGFFLVLFFLLALVLLRRFLAGGIRRKVLHEWGDTAFPYLAIPLVVIVYTMLVSIMFEAGHQRYRAPTDLLIFFFTAFGIHLLVHLEAGSGTGPESRDVIG